MYEKTIGGKQKIYNITLNNSTYLTIYEMLSAAAKNDLNLLINDNHVVVDGYIKPENEILVKHSKGSSWTETISANEIYTSPCYNWHNELVFSGAGSAVVRLFIS